MPASDVISSEDTYDSYSGDSGSWGSGSGGADSSGISMSFLEGAQLAGTVLAVAGAVTGNKRLMQAGALIGIGASIASAYSSTPEGAKTSASSDISNNANASYSSAADSQAAYDAMGPQAEDASIGYSSAADSQAAADAGYGWGADAGSAGAQPQTGNDGLTQSQLTGDAQSQPSGAITPPDYSLSASGIGGQQGVALQNSSLGQNTGSLANASNRLNSTPTTDQGIVGRTIGWLNNRENAGIVKLGAGLIGGALQSYQQERTLDEQRRARDEQRQYVEDRRQRFNRSILNQNLNTR